MSDPTPEPAPPPNPPAGPSGDLAARAAELRSEIALHNHRYHDEDAPTISDADYDELVRELRRYEEEFPELVVAESPTQRVGGTRSTLFAPVRHRLPMMSLDNAFSSEELVAWGERLERRLGVGVDGEPVGYITELKIDGVAISLLYEDGRAGARRDARRRAGGRGRHRQRAHDRRHPPSSAGGGALGARGAG